MGIAIDTIAFSATNPGAGGAVATMAPGDSATVRANNPAGKIVLDQIFRQGATEGFIRIRSPRMHDNVQGIRFIPSETPAAALMPSELSQPLFPQDNLIIEIAGGAAEVDAGAVVIYYSDLAGSEARLKMPGDVLGIIEHVVTVEVDFNTAATAGQWADTAINATFDLLRANRDYAVFGYVTDVAVDAMGIKGTDTGNYRVCGPGVLRSEVTARWFLDQSLRSGIPYIPIINSANKFNTFLSAQAVATATAVKGQLILGLLQHNLS